MLLLSLKVTETCQEITLYHFVAQIFTLPNLRDNTKQKEFLIILTDDLLNALINGRLDPNRLVLNIRSEDHSNLFLMANLVYYCGEMAYSHNVVSYLE